MLNAVAIPDTSRGEQLAALSAAVRPEFAGEVIRIDPDDPVFGRGCCAVAGCERTSWAREMCAAHHQRWCQHGKPAVDQFRATTGPIAARAGSEMVDAFDLSALADQPRLEVAYILQCRHDDRSVRVPPSTIRHLVGLLADSGVASLLDRPIDVWLDAVRARGWKDPTRTIALLRYAQRRLSDLAGIDLDAEYASDIWVAARLGIRVCRTPNQIRFDAIAQPWLRAAVKRWARLRLGSGKTFGTVHVDARAMLWFSRFLAQRDTDTNAAAITCDALERYLVWLTASHLVAHTTSAYITCLRSFLDACRRHDWLPGLAATAAVYNDDLPRRPRPLPRFIAEFVMSQLEHPDNLAALPDGTTRAQAAGVSRSWLYRQPDLRAEIDPLRNSRTEATTVPSTQRASTDSLKRRLEDTLDEIHRLKAENHHLRQQVARRFGQERADRTIRP